MDQRDGIVLMRVTYETAQQLDYLSSRYGVDQRFVIKAAVAVLSSMIEHKDATALAFMDRLADHEKRQLETMAIGLPRRTA